MEGGLRQPSPTIDATEIVDLTNLVTILSLICPRFGGKLLCGIFFGLESESDGISIFRSRYGIMFEAGGEPERS